MTQNAVETHLAGQPRVLEALLRAGSVLWILIEHPGHEVQSVHTTIVQKFAEVGVLVENRMHQLANVVTLERDDTGQHHVQYDASGPHVNLLVVDVHVSCEDLWC